MRPDLLFNYLAEAETALRMLKGCHFEKYEEEILNPERANLRVRARFATGHLLEINEAVVIVLDTIAPLSYRYHFQDQNNDIVFRYDNTPHFPALQTFPHHKHLPASVVSATKPSLTAVVAEIKQHLSTRE